MKTKKLSQLRCNKIIQKYQSGYGYKRISRVLKTSRTTVRAVIKKWKEYGGVANLLAADLRRGIYAKAPPVKENSAQTEGHLEEIQKLRIVKKEQKTFLLQSQCSLTGNEQFNKAGQKQSATPRCRKQMQSCEIAGAVIAARGTKCWFTIGQNSCLLSVGAVTEY